MSKSDSCPTTDQERQCVGLKGILKGIGDADLAAAKPIRCSIPGPMLRPWTRPPCSSPYSLEQMFQKLDTLVLISGLSSPAPANSENATRP